MHIVYRQSRLFFEILCFVGERHEIDIARNSWVVFFFFVSENNGFIFRIFVEQIYRDNMKSENLADRLAGEARRYLCA